MSYIIAGDEQLDMAEAVRKIGETFNTEEIILGVSIVMMPSADGEKHTHSLFEADEKYSAPLPIGFSLASVEPLEDGSVWMRYGVNGPVDAN